MYNAVSTSSNTVSFNDSQETKLTVAELLSSLANGDPVNPTQYSSGVLTPTTLTNGIPSSLTSGTTPLLTPSTLASIEQIIELHNEPTTVSSDLTTQSGFVPPVVEPITSTIPTMVKQEYTDMSFGAGTATSDEDPEWLPTSSKRARMSGGSGSLVATNPAPNYTLPAVTPNATVTGSGGRRPTGPRARRPAVNLTPEEEERRYVRRERNKQAAAKCRQRRVDLTNTLINESEGLEDEQATLEEEIQTLQAQKEQLEFLLEAHKPLCTKKCHGSTAAAVTMTSSLAGPAIKVEKPVSPPSSRPTTLPLRPRTATVAASHHPVSDAAGIPITTPSNGVNVFNFGLEAMMDGHTGLTPLTGAPSCASEVQRSVSDSSSSPSETLSSPTTLMAL